MKMRFIFIVLAIIAVGSLHAQGSKSELDRKASKGATLMDNGKLEDAIAIFNDILSKDPTMGNALLLRARTKWELGAYKGAKKDCFAYMDIYGIDAPVAGLLGKTEKSMENYKQALAYLKTALLFDPSGEEYLLDRADIFYNLGLDDQACEDWYTAKESGSETASRFIKANCRSYKTKKEKPKKNKPPRIEEDYTDNQVEEDVKEEDYTQNNEEDETTSDDITYEEETTDSSESEEGNTEVIDDEETDDEVIDEENEEEVIEDTFPIDDSVEELYIDDELTILLADGIGSRKLIEKPDILILSDKSGDVVVNVCIDRLGRVQNPTLNSEYSSITAPSLISLALRESSNFRFARSSRKSHCGTITYKITGSE